jgi:hypothetical protein
LHSWPTIAQRNVVWSHTAATKFSRTCSDTLYVQCGCDDCLTVVRVLSAKKCRPTRLGCLMATLQLSARATLFFFFFFFFFFFGLPFFVPSVPSYPVPSRPVLYRPVLPFPAPFARVPGPVQVCAALVTRATFVPENPDRTHVLKELGLSTWKCMHVSLHSCTLIKFWDEV